MAKSIELINWRWFAQDIRATILLTAELKQTSSRTCSSSTLAVGLYAPICYRLQVDALSSRPTPIIRLQRIIIRLLTAPFEAWYDYDTIRYDTRCYFNVRSKADISQLNLPHGNRQLKSVKTEKKLKSKKTDMLRSSSKQSGKSI